MSTTYAVRWLRLTLLCWLMLPSMASAAGGEELAILPNEADYDAQDRGEDCSVMRAVIRHSEADLIEIAQQRQSYKLVVLQKQQDVAACAQREHLPLSREPADLALVAEVCRNEYESWIYVGAHYRLLRDDNNEAMASLRTLVGHATRRCLPLPEAPALLSPPPDGEIPPPPTI